MDEHGHQSGHKSTNKRRSGHELEVLVQGRLLQPLVTTPSQVSQNLAGRRPSDRQQPTTDQAAPNQPPQPKAREGETCHCRRQAGTGKEDLDTTKGLHPPASEEELDTGVWQEEGRVQDHQVVASEADLPQVGLDEGHGLSDQVGGGVCEPEEPSCASHFATDGVEKNKEKMQGGDFSIAFC